MKLKISSIDRKGLLTRAALNAEAIRDYAETMRETPSAIPSVLVFAEGETYRLADGFHRVAAALSLGLDEIDAEVKDGDYAAALRAALLANLTHGMRRTAADKRQAMKLAYEQREILFGGEPSVREFSAVCGVSVGTSQSFLHDISVLNLNTPVEKKACAPTPAEVKAPSEASAPTDRFGLEIPSALAPAFDSKTLNSLLSLVRKTKRLAVYGAKERDLGLAALPAQEVEMALSNLLAKLKFARPFCVCRMCRGEGCRACRDRGFQTKAEYDLNPEEYK